MNWFAPKQYASFNYQPLRHEFTKGLRRLANRLKQLLPRYCELCHGELREQEWQQKTLTLNGFTFSSGNSSARYRASQQNLFCHFCISTLSQKTQYRRCDQCDLPLSLEDYQDQLIVDSYCGECLKQKPSYDRILCGYIFQHPVDALINRFKHHNGHYLAAGLAPNLLERINFEYHCLPQLIVPVPIHWTKRLRRGYNQSDLLACELSQQLGIPWQRLLKKSHRTSLQQGLNRKQRLRNLKNSFQCDAQTLDSLPQCDHVALVDDVITTGATAEELAKLLKKQGVRRVDIWGLARTPK